MWKIPWVLTALILPCAAQMRPVQLNGPLVRIPSPAAGSEGILLRVAPPKQPRYADGAPVVVHVPGGFSQGSVTQAPSPLNGYGFIDIAFVFPGGQSEPPQPGEPLRSGGTYDYRGADSMRGLADVIIFAAGRKKSLEGKTLQDYAGGVRALTDEVGVIGWSLGGPTVAGALGLYGKEIAGLRWYASYESPYGEGIIDAQFGSRKRANPFYNAETGELDLSALRYGKEVRLADITRILPQVADVRGVLYLDGNRNGVFDPDADFPFSGIVVPGPRPNVYYSPMLTRAALQKKLFGDEWPEHIATLEQTVKFTGLRDGVSQVPRMVAHLPQLAVGIFASAEDHVQATADHRHILAQYHAFQAAGAKWIRLNPDAHYVEWVMGRPPATRIQNPVGATFDRRNIRAAMEPEPREGGPNDFQGTAAVACELADRTRWNVWTPTLEAVLYPEAPRAPVRPRAAAPTLYLTIVMHNEEPNIRQPDYLNRDFYLQNREALRQLCLTIKKKGATFNFQSDWNFLQAAAKYDAGEVIAGTGGKNIVKWMVDDLGFEADPHAHATKYNYADVAYLHTLLGVEPSKVVGGFIWAPVESADWEQFRAPIKGWKYPDYTWMAETLWGAATFLHKGKDDQSFGIWRPKDKANFLVEDPAQRLNNIGNGCYTSVSSKGADIAGILRFVQAAARGGVSPGGYYTANVFISQGRLDLTLVDHLAQALDTLELYVKQGLITWSPLTRTVNRWRTEHQGRAFRLDCADLPPAGTGQ